MPPTPLIQQSRSEVGCPMQAYLQIKPQPRPRWYLPWRIYSMGSTGLLGTVCAVGSEDASEVEGYSRIFWPARCYVQ